MIILSAALDLVGPAVPKAAVLLCNVIPSFCAKLCLPYVIHTVPYSIRIILFVTLSTWGMLLIALTPAYTEGGTIATKMSGVVLASLSSGAGELSFLGLTHFYGPFSLAAWGSGTGGAGLVGAGMYAFATTSIGMSSKGTLLTSAFLPIIMLFSFFVVLPREPLKSTSRIITSTILHGAEEAASDDTPPDDRDSEDEQEEAEGLLQRAPDHSTSTASKSHTPQTWLLRFRQNLLRSRSLFFP